MASDRIWGNSKGRIILIDTSALFMIFERSIRIEDELIRLVGKYQILVLQSIENELNILIEQGTEKQKKLAKLSLEFIKRYEKIAGSYQSNADDALLESAENLSAIVFTNDVELRKKCHEKQISTICLRGNNYLMVE